MKIVFFNCSIMTTEGIFVKKKITLNEVKKMIADSDYESAIDHESTAEILSELLNINVPVNRVKYELACDEYAIIFQLRNRPSEGKILDRKEIERVGFDFFIVKKYNQIMIDGYPYSYEKCIFPFGGIARENPDTLTIY